MAALNVFLMIPKTELTTVWQEVSFYKTFQERWNAYLNQLTLRAVLPWLREQAPHSGVAMGESALQSIWSFLNGCGFIVNGQRWVVIPTEAASHEVRVPQEWVDIPSWAGDYFLVAHVQPDEGLVQITGGVTHAQLKMKGRLNINDRTYCLPQEQWLGDTLLLVLSEEFRLLGAIQQPIEPLPALSLMGAQQLIKQLADRTVVVPRLSIPFQQWGSLIEHGGWRQQLYRDRQGLAAQASVSDWLAVGIPKVDQGLGWQPMPFEASFAVIQGVELPIQQQATTLTRRLVMDGLLYQLQLIWLLGNSWRLELRNLQPEGLIPKGLALRLLTEDLQLLGGNEAIAESQVGRLSIQFKAEPGERWLWEIEPLPWGYDREVLQF